MLSMVRTISDYDVALQDVLCFSTNIPHDKTILNEMLLEMTPDRAGVFFSSMRNKKECKMSDQHYGTKYNVTDYVFSNTKKYELTHLFKLPKLNQYLPENTELLTLEPVMTDISMDNIYAYWRPTVEYGLPYVCIQARISIPKIFDSGLNHTKCVLYLNYCMDIIKTLWSLLDEPEDHEKIVLLLKKFDKLLPKIFSDVVT